jgi:hypothetical protein
MFNHKEGFQEIADGIYLYKNFLNDQEIQVLYNKAISLEEEDWHHPNPIEWYSTRTSNTVDELTPIFDKAQDIFSPTHSLTPSMSMQRMFAGDSMFEHTDTSGDEPVTANDAFGTCHIIEYGVVVYFNKFEGGEIYYPDLNIEYKPEPGDLLVHKANITHGVKEVTSGPRYVYANFVFPL